MSWFGRKKRKKQADTARKILAVLKELIGRMPVSDAEAARGMIDNYVAAFNTGLDRGIFIGRFTEREQLLQAADLRMHPKPLATGEEPPPPMEYDDKLPGEVQVGRNQRTG